MKELLDASFRTCSRLGVALTDGSAPKSWLLTRRRLHATLGHAKRVLSHQNILHMFDACLIARQPTPRSASTSRA